MSMIQRLLTEFFGYLTRIGMSVGLMLPVIQRCTFISPALPDYISDKHGVEMKLIHAGTFQMGGEAVFAARECEEFCASCDCSPNYFKNEEPTHALYLEAYYVDLIEVTNASYALCVETGLCTAPASNKSFTRPSYFGNPDFANYPVIYVSWEQALEYCIWRGARLPTEAEWEKAARGGLKEKLYPWGDTHPDCTKGNYGGTRGCVGDTSQVGNYPPNGYGLFDMAGNVWELVWDWYSFTFYERSPFENPSGPPSSDTRVLRGGSWNDNGDYLRVSLRERYDPTVSNDHIGFRCARSP